MRLIRSAALLSIVAAACASKPDHFYALSILPDREQVSRSPPTTHILLNVTVPSMVDRAEMVINSSDHKILVLDHQRWAAPLADEVSQTLARDIERRRSDVLVGDRRFDQRGDAPTKIKVDIVEMSARRGGSATIEAHWHIVDGRESKDLIGSATYEAPVSGDDYSAVAHAYSIALSSLADGLVGQLPPHQLQPR
jgi:uncharacterized lipoprotein YmbA